MIEGSKESAEVAVEGRFARALRSRHAEWFLGLISFLESVFLPIITDPFLVVMTLARSHNWARLAFIVTFTSVLGGVAAYVLGMLFFDLIGAKLVAFYGLENQFAKTAQLFDKNILVATLIGAFTPIPYKIFALSAGFLRVDIILFVVGSIIGRGARFFIVGYLTKYFGRSAYVTFSRHLGVITVLAVIAVAAYALYSLSA